MPETKYNAENVPVVYIRYKGVWDMEDLYQQMVDWFRQRKYHFYEKIYKHKHPSPFGIERQYVWAAHRHEDDYLSFHISIYFHTYDAHDVEVLMKDGSTRAFTKGRIWMEFTGKMEYDDEKRWEERAFYYSLRNVYNKYVIKKKKEQLWWDQLWYREIHQLYNLVQQRLKMESEGFEHRYWTGVHR
ncbi:TPA: hypothetical protein HA361_05600 [Candidatus Woesearchaeota archaeon]|nr:hypothetical protein [Candidatus Woesearchaeota archaeon]HII69073.1 hypothetical protein [Candidatus Woesearchaeota archaeon]